MPAIPVPVELLADPLEFDLMTGEGALAEDEQELLSPGQSGPFEQPVNHLRHTGHERLSLQALLRIVEYPRRPVPIGLDRSQNVACVVGYQSVLSAARQFVHRRYSTQAASFPSPHGDVAVLKELVAAIGIQRSWMECPL